MGELILRFFIGGVVVSVFALLGDLLKPKSFAGLFGAAPSVALATLGLTIAQKGGHYAAIESHSMLFGSVALFVYCQLVCWLLLRYKWSAFTASLLALAPWFAVAFGLWAILIR